MFPFCAAVRFRTVLLLAFLGLAVSRAEAVGIPNRPYQQDTTSSSLTMGWNPVNGACGYRISIVGTETYQDVGNNSFAATFNNLSPATAYTFSVRALDCSTRGYGDGSEYGSGTTTSSGGNGGGGDNGIPGRQTIKGTVRNSRGQGLAGFYMSCTKSDGSYSRSSPTGSNGFYESQQLPPGKYKVTVSPPYGSTGSYQYDPRDHHDLQIDANSDGHAGIDFTVKQAGRIHVLVRNDSGGINDVRVSASQDGADAGGCTTGSGGIGGVCDINVDDVGTYTVRAQSATNGRQYDFAPSPQTVSLNAQNSAYSNVTFTATLQPPKTYSISGQVHLENSLLPDAQQISLTLSGQPDAPEARPFAPQAAQTQGAGADRTFSFSNVPEGVYEVRPTAPTAPYKPPSHGNIRVSGRDSSGVYFYVDFGAPPQVSISKPAQPPAPPTIIPWGQGLQEVMGSSVAGEGRKISAITVSIYRIPKMPRTSVTTGVLRPQVLPNQHG